MKLQSIPSFCFSKLFFRFRKLISSVNEHLVNLPAVFRWFSKIQSNPKLPDVRTSLLSSICIFVLLFICTDDSYSQVTLSGAASGNGNYTTLSGAFTAVNSAGQSGFSIIITLTGNTDESPGGAVLDSGLWTSLTINPTGVRTISGAINAGSSLINLNGADNVIIDGLNSGGNSLTISNTTLSSTAGTSTINFGNNASNNILTRCTILGSSTVLPTAQGGVVAFGTGSSNGNDNNLISFCDIGPAGSNLPSKGISFIGSSVNDGDTVRNCNVYNYFSPATASAGIYAGSGSSDLCFINNKFYQSSSRVQSTGSQHSAIWIDNTSGNNFSITGNTIGYSNSSGTGVYGFQGVSNSKFFPIFLNAGSTVPSNIQNNTIAAISVSGSTSGTGTNAPFAGILMLAGSVNIGNLTGNTIGNLSTNGNITYSTNTNSSADIVGIYAGGSVSDTIANNTIGSITGTETQFGNINMYGIRHLASGSSVCLNNIIGGTAANSIQSSTSSSMTLTVGIEQSGGASTVSGNTIRNLKTTSGAQFSIPASLIGIYLSGNNIHSVIQNSIYALSTVHTSQHGVVTGMLFNVNSTGSTIERNFIHSLSVSNNNSDIKGIHVNQGSSGYYNNMIRLGINSQGIEINVSNSITGILETNGSNNFYFNSVYIGGTPISTGDSYALRSTVLSLTRNYKNNIFYNGRSNSGLTSGRHYAISVNGTSPNPAGVSCNYNILYSPGIGGFVGFYNGTDCSTLSQWQSASGLDSVSNSSNPDFINPSGDFASVNLHIASNYIPTFAEANGVNIPSITNDFDGDARSAFTPVDIGADAGNFREIDRRPTIISFTPIPGDSNKSSYNFTGVVISDSDGVATSAGLKPRTYFKKKYDPNVFNDNTNSTTGWKYSVANGTTSPFDFTLDFTRLNSSLTTNDTILYFVVAQDMADTPYISSNTVVFMNYPTDIQLTSAAFPVTGTPNLYRITRGGLSGDYTVGLSMFNSLAGTNITFEKRIKKVSKEISVTEGEGINKAVVNKIMETEEEIFIPMQNGSEYKGPLGIKRSDNPDLRKDALAGTYATLTAAINDLNTWGAIGPVRFFLLDNSYTSETLPITIFSWTGASAINTLTIKPSSGVTSEISGSNSTAVIDINGGDYVTIDGSNSPGGTTKDLTIKNNNGNMIRYINDARQNILKNTIIKATNYGVSISNTTGSSGNDSITIQNNDITGSVTSINIGISNLGSGSTSQQKNSNIIIRGNRIYNFSKGIMDFGNSVGTLYQSNEFFNTVAQGSMTVIDLGGSTTEGFEISKNNFHDLLTTTGNIIGIAVAGPSNVTSLIANNFININSSSAGEIYGICDIASVSKYDVYYNTVILSGTRSGGSLPTASYYKFTPNGFLPSTANLKNNILINKIAGGTSSNYVLRIDGGYLSSVTSNYNDLHNTGAGTNVFAYDGTDRLNLAAWQTATSKDSNSISADPLFFSSTNLHIDSTVVSPVSNIGTPIAGITTDFDGNTRNASNPDIGADEFTQINMNLKMLIEGFYDAGSNLQVNDTIRVYLRNSNSPFNKVDSAIAVVNDSGRAIMSFRNAAAGNYYLQIKHRNALETWSSIPIVKTQGGITQYDFTTAATQAFGSNMKQVDISPVKFAIYGGDENQDGTIDLSDIIDIYNDAQIGNSGYLATDVNGDEFVDVSDIIIAYNNAVNIVIAITP